MSGFLISFLSSSTQEPGTDAEIKEFATGKYGVQFDMFSKINVNGDNAHPLWKYLKNKQTGFLIKYVSNLYRSPTNDLN